MWVTRRGARGECECGCESAATVRAHLKQHVAHGIAVALCDAEHLHAEVAARERSINAQRAVARQVRLAHGLHAYTNTMMMSDDEDDEWETVNANERYS